MSGRRFQKRSISEEDPHHLHHLAAPFADRLPGCSGRGRGRESRPMSLLSLQASRRASARHRDACGRAGIKRRSGAPPPRPPPLVPGRNLADTYRRSRPGRARCRLHGGGGR
jgi:hypothetical protein